MNEFLNDKSPTAFEKLIDKLLASKHYGEKWGRHWLDIVRFAETNSYERDGKKPEAWRYRQWVVDAFNKDKPYEKEWKEEDKKETSENISEDDDLRTMAITSEEEDVSSFQKMKNFLTSNDEGENENQNPPKEEEKVNKKIKKGKTSRVSALANRRRK